MAKPLFLNYTLQPLSGAAAFYADNHVLTSTAPFTLLATKPSDGAAHQVAILNNSGVTSLAGLTFNIFGYDQDGLYRSTSIAGGIASATVETATYFKEITEISLTTAGSTGLTVDVGIADEIATPTVCLDMYTDQGVSLITNISGTINYTWQYTGQDVQNTASTSAIVWFNHDDTNLVSATADRSGNFAFKPIATRVIVNSYSSGATLDVTVIENGK